MRISIGEQFFRKNIGTSLPQPEACGYKQRLAMKKSLLFTIPALVAALLTSCTTITVDAPQPAELSLGRGARISIVPEAGSDSGELAHALFQLFAGQGYYQLVDRANLGDAINERNFQRMSFVENRTSGRIKGVDAFVYLQAEGMSGAKSDSSTYTWSGKSVTAYTTKTTANYIANYRAVMTSSSQIAGGRRIELSDSQTAFSADGYPAAPDPYPMIAGMRNKAAQQIFESLHPSVLKIRRTIGGTKSESAKQAVRFANAGLWSEATTAAEQGIKEQPTDPEAHYILAIVYQGTGRYADAERVLRQLVGMSSNSKYAAAIRENQAVWQNAARFQQQM